MPRQSLISDCVPGSLRLRQPLSRTRRNHWPIQVQCSSRIFLRMTTQWRHSLQYYRHASIRLNTCRYDVIHKAGSIHNVSQCCQRSTEQWPWVTCAKNLAKIGRVVPEICSWINTDMLIALFVSRKGDVTVSDLGNKKPVGWQHSQLTRWLDHIAVCVTGNRHIHDMFTFTVNRRCGVIFVPDYLSVTSDLDAQCQTGLVRDHHALLRSLHCWYYGAHLAAAFVDGVIALIAVAALLT